MNKVLQERGFGSLPKILRGQTLETKLNQSQLLKLIFLRVRSIGCGLYAVSSTQHRSIFSDTVPFPRRLQNFGCDDWREAQDVKILEVYDHTLPQKEKDPRSYTLPCLIHNICFDKALVELGVAYERYAFSTYANLV
ncbi:hypothetical protein Tco_0997430 [Tanacetum coccineum]